MQICSQRSRPHPNPSEAGLLSSQSRRLDIVIENRYNQDINPEWVI